jgi:NSS family neurotransmitter:Na+ symporter
MSKRPTFSSHLTALMAMAGLAIGIGNVWRFPYMMGQHGGSAFLFVYIVFMVLLATPALMAEWALGRDTGRGPVEAYRNVFGPVTGLLLGLVLVFSVFMAVAYYDLVIGNIFYSAWFAARHGFSEENMDLYASGLGNHGVQYLFAAAVTLLSLWVVSRGLHRGIELFNKYAVPLFGLSAVYMVVVALNLEGATEKLIAFMKPDFSRVGPDVLFAAMGQACFSVGISGVIGVMYGSYLKQEERLAPTALATGVLDTGAAMLGTLFVIPAVLVFGLDMASGPGLLFETMPRLFAQMPGGAWLASLFLSTWALVALLSAIATFAAITHGLAEISGVRLSRQRVLLLVGVASLGTMLPIAFNPHWIGALDLVFGSGMFTVGALMAAIAAGWGMGSKRLRQQIQSGLGPRSAAIVTLWIRYVIPLVLGAILAGYLVSIIGG